MNFGHPRELAERIAKEAIESAMPRQKVREALSTINRPDSCIVISVGKAALEMAEGARDVWGIAIKTSIVLTNYLPTDLPQSHEIFIGNHPIPGPESFQASRLVWDRTSSLSEKDTVLFLLSGGGSSLFEFPRSEISQSLLADWYKRFLSSGASIREVNSLRPLLSGVKAGRFRKHCEPSGMIQLILSDVLEPDPFWVSSGPALPYPVHWPEIERILGRYGWISDSELFLKGIPPVVKPDPRDQVIVIGSLEQALQAAESFAIRMGFRTERIKEPIIGQAKDAGKTLAKLGKRKNSEGPLIVIGGGETTVTLKGKGRGGRNQELALSFAKEIRGESNLFLLSFGTDGIDGNSRNAGGFADGSTWDDILSLGIDPEFELETNDSATALEAIGNTFITGPTGTNVNDVQILVII
ncbi:MOFRL family protein [Leptospira fainei serovar Hurstbridge str. BUT 6]|uniref:MOFRL family protein n=2 Tax=Leptospira fainei TaxID=48782 RepID=S3UXX0_9LEPT|nr:MOFRL family protein [Leptospira fainei serovar Hurstbridge str. BUT 6]